MVAEFKFIEHPADTGVEVWADTLPELFEYAALGLFATGIAYPKKIQSNIRKEIRAIGEDLKELMVNFLSEFLFYIDSENLVFSKIKILDLSTSKGCKIRADAWGEEFNLEKHGSLTDIKAITYHQMVIEETSGRWHAKIIFDI